MPLLLSKQRKFATVSEHARKESYQSAIVRKKRVAIFSQYTKKIELPWCLSKPEKRVAMVSQYAKKKSCHSVSVGKESCHNVSVHKEKRVAIVLQEDRC